MRGMLFGAALLLAAACGGSECKDAAEAICAKACACGAAQGECAIGDASGGLSFDSAGDCRALFGLACSSGGGGDVDWGACQEALETATCESGRLVVPASCDAE